MSDPQPSPDTIARRNRRTLGVIAVIIVIAASVPFVVRHYTPPIPAISEQTMELLPPASSRSETVVLHARPGPWLEAVAPILPGLDEATARIFPAKPIPVLGVLLEDETTARVVWEQIFGTNAWDDATPGIGYAGFFLYRTFDVDAAGIGSPAQLADVARAYAQSMMEQQMGEKIRGVPGWYRAVVEEMVAQYAVPEYRSGVAERYRLLINSDSPTVDEASFKRAFEGKPDPLNQARAALMADRFLRASDPAAFVRMVCEGEVIETAFRKMATTSAPLTPRDEGQPVRTSMQGVLVELELDALESP